ncbi:hypothetical protein [Candidatus Nitrosocosmicus hydrocola]|uniref:hypothetical protein n=1 Tax=Candidatus Nitrosocosmicus hydrocola TaxID=1826872 RepID=UPI0011E5988C|nr:hypothetical protein [Candidatus Nitrosocosmicus hydrocola]
MITLNDIYALKRWVFVLVLIVTITVILGLIIKIPFNQLAGSIIITTVLIISAFVFQKFGSRYSDKNDEDNTR